VVLAIKKAISRKTMVQLAQVKKQTKTKKSLKTLHEK
jgi:hypothetical protein